MGDSKESMNSETTISERNYPANEAMQKGYSLLESTKVVVLPDELLTAIVELLWHASNRHKAVINVHEDSYGGATCDLPCYRYALPPTWSR